MRIHSLESARPRGFALIVTLSLMILLTVIAVGLLSLSSISLRSSASQSATNTARSNARMAVILALGELQKSAGDDRRITADGSIYDGAAQPNAVGVWKSWSPKRIETPDGSAPDYLAPKSDTGFVSWLVSSSDPAPLKTTGWAKTGSLTDPINLYNIAQDGFDLAGSKVSVLKTSITPGAFAWVVSQAATKAKINVGGPEDNRLVTNDTLQAQPRPSLGLGATFKNPVSQREIRANKVISMSQAKLDTELWNTGAAIQGYSNYTTQGFGVLADVVNGGLKTDLSLGFELNDGEFAQDQWAGVKNPFRYASAPALGAFVNYKGERPLYKPLNASGTITSKLDFWPANVLFEFPSAAVPTFATLRSFYRTPYYLYNTAAGATVFERGPDHVALTQRAPSVSSDPYSPPGAIPKAVNSQTGYRPVLDRMLFVMSAGLAPNKEVRLIVTPLITLWNPYNTALQIEGAVAYPWIDVPFNMDWKFTGGVAQNYNMYFSGLMGQQFKDQGHGRSVDPFFYAAITSNGQPGATTPILFQPGEVKVFAPVSSTPKEFLVGGSIRDRTVFLKPVDDPNQLTTRGGLSVPMRNAVRQIGFTRTMLTTESVQVVFKSSGSEYPFFMSLEDATRAKGTNPDRSLRGQIINDVQTLTFAAAVAGGTSPAPTITSPVWAYSKLNTEPQPFGVIETYHRTALASTSSDPSDLLFTNNPRQPFINRYLAQGNFKTGPHYETKIRAISSLSGLMESFNGNSYYGASNNSNSGKTHLSFFEVPRSPMLSLAGFQHADLSNSAYAAANQFANSWAGAYLARDKTAKKTTANGVTDLPVYDHSYLANEALWDSFFFSGAAPDVQPGSGGGSSTVWNAKVATEKRSLNATITGFVNNPTETPLRNPRHRLHRGAVENSALISSLTSPSGCTKIAAHLLVDGAFNINSTQVDAWAAFLGGLRGQTFDVTGGSSPSGNSTAVSRFRNPIGKENDNWQGFRTLSDAQIKTLADNIVKEVKLRGPFLSLGEFVNRRIVASNLGLKGALQSAIDTSGLNGGAKMQDFPTAKYPSDSQSNIVPNDTGVGIPGYLTQADLLQSIAPVITPRSDTFTIRAYGDARDKSGNVIAKAWCEAVVQRNPEFLDPSDAPTTPLSNVKAVNQTFGRGFAIVSFRYLSPAEVKS